MSVQDNINRIKNYTPTDNFRDLIHEELVQGAVQGNRDAILKVLGSIDEIVVLDGQGSTINTENLVYAVDGKLYAYIGSSPTWTDNIGSGEVDGDWTRCSLDWLAKNNLKDLSKSLVSDLKQYINCTGDKVLTINGNVGILIGDRSFKTVETTITESDLDTGSFQVGKDYYVYACNLSGALVFKISLNTTFPSGFNETNSRKIGGFHYGDCRRINSNIEPINSSNVAWGTGWEDNVYQGILPYSVWTLLHRPKSDPEGMVFCPSIGKWVDIYLQSVNYKSEYGVVPMTGSEGVSYYDFHEKVARRIKKTPLSYFEFCSVADGSPNGRDDTNEYSWSKTTNTGRNLCGIVSKAVSVYGLKDCAGNVYEVGKDLSWATTGTWGWKNAAEIEKGAAYTATENDPKLMLHGGYWLDGVQCGSRTIICYYFPWRVSSFVGCRFSSDSL